MIKTRWLSSTDLNFRNDFKQYALDLPPQRIYHIFVTAGWVAYVFGYKWFNEDGCFYIIRGSSSMHMLGHYIVGNDFVFDE